MLASQTFQNAADVAQALDDFFQNPETQIADVYGNHQPGIVAGIHRVRQHYEWNPVALVIEYNNEDKPIEVRERIWPKECRPESLEEYCQRRRQEGLPSRQRCFAVVEICACTEDRCQCFCIVRKDDIPGGRVWCTDTVNGGVPEEHAIAIQVIGPYVKRWLR